MMRGTGAHAHKKKRQHKTNTCQVYQEKFSSDYEGKSSWAKEYHCNQPYMRENVVYPKYNNQDWPNVSALTFMKREQPM